MSWTLLAYVFHGMSMRLQFGSIPTSVRHISLISLWLPALKRTWDEYNTVAAAVHGKVFNNQTLIGSCIGRLKGCAGAYWANLVLSSITQYRGTWEGHLFDSADMKPLLGEAFEKMLEIMEIQARYGPADEFEGCVDINADYMNDGSCVLSYSK